MRVAWRSLLVCVLGVVLGVALFATCVPAAEPSGGQALPEGSLLDSPTVVPSVNGLLGGELQQAAREAEQSNPEAVEEREASRTSLEGLLPAQAASETKTAFPGLVERPDGGVPQLPVGESVVGYPSPVAAQIALPEGKRAVLESSIPIALETSAGKGVPLDLSLREAGGGFVPARPDVGVRLPRDLSEGVSLSGPEVSLTPVDEQDSPLSVSEGGLNGSAVFWGDESSPDGVQDLGTLGKPTTGGFDLTSLLFSERSPSVLYFRVGMPVGGRLEDTAYGSLRVAEEGATLAVVLPPTAQDAEGTEVPVSMSHSGSIVRLTVDRGAGGYRYPIAVDPTVADGQFRNETFKSNWAFAHNGPFFNAPEHPEGESWIEAISGSHSATEWGRLSYTTRGASVIMRAHVEGRWNDERAHIQNYMVLDAPGPPVYRESYSTLPVNTEERWPGEDVGATVCAPELKCSETTTLGASENNNTAAYEQQATGNGEGVSVSNTLKSGYVEITQEASPELSFNTWSPYIWNQATKEYTQNVLYGSGGWLGSHSGAFEVHAKDPGIGIGHYRLLSSGWGDEHWYYALGECVGVQCPPEINQPYGYNSKYADGEVSFEAFVEDQAGLSAQIYPQKIKVDNTAPHNIEVSGFINGDELSAGETLLKIKASDGSGSTPSSGIKSITVSADGTQIAQAAGQAPAGCSTGLPCTASGEWPLAGRNYATGQHSLIVTATDNARNVTKEEFTFVVHQASPVSVGPGSLNPESGEYTLGVTDVSMGGGLQVSRSYNSRHLTAGAGGPFGPQWSVGVGGMETVEELPGGSVILSSGGGGGAMFVMKKKGEYESPPGDANLKLEAKESAGVISEYVLTNATAGSSTTFTLPEGGHSVPVYSTVFGTSGTGSGQFKTPESVATDASGDVWVVDNANNRIEEFGAEGKFVRSVGSTGSGNGQFSGPWGIAINQTTGNIYVSDQANARVEEFNREGVFIRKFGTSGSGPGQFGTMAGVAVDSTGNLWVCDYSHNRIEEFSPEGVYATTYGTEGTGNGQFKGPLNIAFSGGNLYITDYSNNRVQELSSAGGYIRQFGTSGSGNGQFSKPYGIASDPNTGNVYVVDSGNNRVQEFNSAGTYLGKFGATGSNEGDFSAPLGIVADGFGDLYVTDSGNNRIEDWAIQWGSGPWMPHASNGPLPTDTQTFTYRTVEVEGKQVTQPLMELSPKPSGVECPPEEAKLEPGCRALIFKYGTETKATGENESEWGEYNGRLKEVRYKAYDPKTKTMREPAVVEYRYDKHGRLRASWDPRLTTPLKTTYGYDEEGHVTALSPAGQEPWLFTYGTIVGDPGSGRLLKFVRPNAETGLWNGILPKNTEAPKISGSVVVGVTIGVSNGAWANAPTAFSYQWERCNAEGKECVVIGGAANASYTVTKADAGHKLMSQVIATNGGGSVTVSALSPVATGAQQPVFSSQFEGFGTAKGTASVTHVVRDSKGNLWALDIVNNEVDEFSNAGVRIQAFRGELFHEIASPQSLAVDSKGNVWVAKIVGITEYGETGKYIKEVGISGTGQLNVANGLTFDEKGNLWVADTGNSRIMEFTSEGTYIRQFGTEGTGKLTEPYDLTVDTKGNVWVADTKDARVVEFNGEGGYLQQFGELGTEGNGRFSLPMGITTDTEGNVWVTDLKNQRVQEFNSKGEYLVQFGSGGAGEGQLYAPRGIATDSKGAIWIAEGKNRIEKWTIPSVTEEHRASSSGSTVEYNVSLSGTGLPTMTKEAVKKWGQEDYPLEATAIFPPDEPQPWPASSYKRATIHYIDAQGRAVNTSVPSTTEYGSVATSEYNATNDVVRALSADNRATALKEGAKSVEAAKKLDTESKYSADGTELLETIGPEHQVKIAKEEKLARNQVKYSYDEGAPEGKTYGLVTRSIDDALVGGKEEDQRTTRTYYSGQNGLGWTLRKPTSVAVDPTGLDMVHATMYDKFTGNVIETKAPGGTAEAVYPPAYTGAFGSEGTGTGQFKRPERVALDASGNVWVDDKDNGRVEKFTASGTYLASYGTKGSGNSQFSSAWGIAINTTTGNVYVSDTGNNRIEELNSSGGFVRTFGTLGTGNGQLKAPAGLTIDGKGNVWVVDEGNSRVEEFSETGTYSNQFGTVGSGNGQLKAPFDIAIVEGDLYVVDTGNNRIEEFSPSGTYLSQFGGTGSAGGQFNGPMGIGVNATNGELVISDPGNNRVEMFTPAGKYLTQFGHYATSGEGFAGPTGVAVSATGEIYVADQYNARITHWQLPGAGGTRLVYGSQFGSKGSGNGQFNLPIAPAVDGNGNVWVTDFYNNRVQKFSASGQFIAAYGSYGTGNGQFKEPGALDINQSTGNVYISDYGNNRIEELSSTGAFVRAFGSLGSGSGQLVADKRNNRIEEFSSTGTFIATYDSLGTGNGQFKEPVDLTFSGGNVYVVDSGNNRVQELSTSGAYIGQFGTEGANSGQFKSAEAIAADATGNLDVIDAGNSRIEEFAANGTFLATFGSSGTGEGQLNRPIGLAINAAGDVYVADAGNNRVVMWAPADQAAHDTKTIYYTAKTEAEITACQNHPEWAGLPCLSEPGAQPETEGLSSLPVTTVTYNIWSEPDTTTEAFPATKTFPSTTRTKKVSYDEAGRVESTEETSSTSDATLPAVHDKYSVTTGQLVEQSTTVEAKTKTITSKYNKLGQLTEYTDADGGITSYAYDEDGRTTEVTSAKGTEEEGKQTYAYDPTTGRLTKLQDNTAKMFTASYDVGGAMTSETYPNGMEAKYTYNAIGNATALGYVKTTHCSSACTLFSESLGRSVHGETLSQASTLAADAYSYDNAGRLIETQETPAGKACTARLYAYDEESDRTGLTKQTCTGEAPEVERHTYDAGDRLTDPGVSYEALGNTTKLPAADAGKAELTTAYYLDGQVATQTQEGKTTDYCLDPEDRVRETASVPCGTATTPTISHYAGPGETPLWTSEGSKKWTRDIPGIDGALTATEQNGGTPVLQLHDLQGNIVATAALSETETKLLSTYQSTEFGVPTTASPPKFSWLGAGGVTSELPTTGVITTGAGSYVPEIGRPLQTAPAIPPAFANGTTPASVVQASNLESLSNQMKGIAIAHEAELEAAARQQAKEEAELNPPIASEAPEPDEGGVREEDPNHIIKLVTPEKAIEWGDALCDCTSAHGAGQVIEAIANSIGVEGAGEAVEEILTGGTLEIFGRELMDCGEALKSNSMNRCAIELHTIAILGVDTWIPMGVGVGRCYYYKKSYKTEKIGLHCPNKKYYKRGSY
jgi:tripartite motif-containing protein 71